MSTESTDSIPTTPDHVIVPTGDTTTRTPRYHRPAANNSLDAACNTLRLDGQELPREYAERRGLQPCQCAACFGVITGAVTAGGGERE